MTEKSLKTQNSNKLLAFIAFNSLVLWSAVALDRFDLTKSLEVWKQISATEGILLLLAPIVTVVLNGILPAQLKTSLVFWRSRHALPGCRAFSSLAKRDPRIDLAALREKLGDLPVEPAEQNRLWYRLSKKHQQKVGVLDAHRDYLLTRDMTALAALFFCVFVILCMARFSVSRALLMYGVLTLAQFLLLSLAARNYGNGFACNVLAEEMQSTE